jgi:hypothetical protein
MNAIGSPGSEVSREVSGSIREQGKWGPEFAVRLLDQWAYLNKVELDFSRPTRQARRQRVL